MMNLNYKTIMYNMGCYDSRLRIICRFIEKWHGPLEADNFLKKISALPNFPSFSLKDIAREIKNADLHVEFAKVSPSNIHSIDCPFIVVLDRNQNKMGDYVLVEVTKCNNSIIKFINERKEFFEINLDDFSKISSGVFLRYAGSRKIYIDNNTACEKLYFKQNSHITIKELRRIRGLCDNLKYIPVPKTENTLGNENSPQKLGLRSCIDVQLEEIEKLNTAFKNLSVVEFNKIDAIECLRLNYDECIERRFDGGVNLGRKALMITVIGEKESSISVNISTNEEPVILASGESLLLKVGNCDGRIEWRTDWSAAPFIWRKGYVIIHWGI